MINASLLVSTYHYCEHVVHFWLFINSGCCRNGLTILDVHACLMLDVKVINSSHGYCV